MSDRVALRPEGDVCSDETLSVASTSAMSFVWESLGDRSAFMFFVEGMSIVERGLCEIQRK